MAKTSTKRPKRKELREIAARRRRNTNIALIAGGVLILAAVAFVIYLNVRSTLPVGEEQSFGSLGNTHIAQGSTSPISYNSVPPSSGPHYPGLAPWTVFPEPIRYEQLVHNLEDGGVIVYYQCEEGCPELVEQLAGVAQPFIDRGEHVVVVPNDPTYGSETGTAFHQDMGSRIALVAWQRVDKFDEFDAERIRSFIERYEGIDHHSG